MALHTRRFGAIGKVSIASFIAVTLLTPVAVGLVRLVPMRDQILHATGALPSFEVATVRPWKRPPPPPPGEEIIHARVEKFSPNGPVGQVSDRVQFVGQAELLIASAYNLPVGSEDSRIVGAPDWASSEENRYDVHAKIDPSMFAAMRTKTAAQQQEQVELMEQSLLADRFKLRVHFEIRQLQTFALVIAKGGSKLRPAKSDEENKLAAVNRGENSELTATSVSMDQLVHFPVLLSGQEVGGHPILDQTNLGGEYDFTLRWSSPQAPHPDAGDNDRTDSPALFTALQEQLGLKLVPSKGPVEVIVIDHIERPTEN